MTDNTPTREHFQEPPHTGGGLIYDSKEKIMGAFHYTQQAAHALGEKVGLLNPQVNNDIGNTTATIHSAINGSDGQSQSVSGWEYKAPQDDTGNFTQGHRFRYVLKKPQSNTEREMEIPPDRVNIQQYSAPQDTENVIQDDRENIRGADTLHISEQDVENTYQPQQGTENILNKAQDTATYLKERAQDSIGYVRDKVQDGAEYIRELGQPQDPTIIDPVYDNPQSNAEYLKEKAQDTANYIKERAQDTVNFIKEKVDERYADQNVKEKKSETNIE